MIYTILLVFLILSLMYLAGKNMLGPCYYCKHCKNYMKLEGKSAPEVDCEFLENPFLKVVNCSHYERKSKRS